MKGAANLVERYLRALAWMHSSQAHEARAQIGNLTLQVGLVAEILQRSDPDDPETRARMARYLEKAQAAARSVHGALERLLAQTELTGRSPGPLDLGSMLRGVGALIAPALEARRVAWRLAVPEASVVLDVDRDALWQALTVALVEGVATMEAGEAIQIALEDSGRCVVTGPRPGDWAEPLREVVEACGGEVRSRAGALLLEVQLPIKARRT